MRTKGERPHNHGVTHLLCPCGSQYIWSAGGPTINIWDARTRLHERCFADDEWYVTYPKGKPYTLNSKPCNK